jgi:ribosomal protein L2
MKEIAMNPKDKEHGEGNYKASREYKEATKKFVDSGKVDEAAREAEPRSAEEKRELERAEQIGKSHSKGEEAGSKP